jgi:hypothetical protein
MAVSGSKNFTVTRTDIINAAMRKTGSYDAGDAPSADESADAVLALNVMIKEWSAKGIDVPWRETITLFLQSGTQSYRIGSTGDHATTSYQETTMSADAAASATTISLTSTSGMTNADYMGIKLDDGSIHWTTISSVAGTTIATGLASAASEGNAVYSYTTKANRPQRIVYANRRSASGQDTEVELIGDIAYRELSNKSSTGPVNQCFYQPTLVNGTLFVWPTGGVDKFMLISQPLVDDFDAASNNPQFPIEWSNAIIWNLAAELAPEYGLPLKERMLLKAEAREKLETVLDYDVENASVIFGRDR